MNPQWNPNKVLGFRDGKNFTRFQRMTLIKNECNGCGSTKHLALDHIVPVFAGGDNLNKNAQTLCRSCNSKKYWQDRAYYKKLREFREPLTPFYGKDNPDPSRGRNSSEGATTRGRACKRSRPVLKVVELVCETCRIVFVKKQMHMHENSKHVFCGKKCRWKFYTSRRSKLGRFGGNSSTSAQPERDDIVWTSGKPEEVQIKSCTVTIPFSAGEMGQLWRHYHGLWR